MGLQRFKFYMHVYSFFLIISLLKISNAVFTFQCPVQSHWKLRAETYCGLGKSYFCLYDKNEQNFTEFCRDADDFDAPVAGSSKGTLQGTDCDGNFYQPYKFLSSGNSRCVYKRSDCSEEGQVVYRNGTEKNDRSCRCDYTRDYDFVTRPNHPCLCVPSKEDCSCYHKTCPNKYILSPEYECLNENKWKLNFNCDSISTVVLSKDSGITSTDNSSFRYHIIAYRNTPHVAVLVVFMLILSVLNLRHKRWSLPGWRLFMFVCELNVGCGSASGTFTDGTCNSVIFVVMPVLQDCLYRMKRKHTDLDTVQIDEVEEKFVSLINNQKSSFENKIDAIDLEKKELEEKISKLEENKRKVPCHVQELQEETIQNWKDKLFNKFVVTKAAESVYQRIKSEKVVAVIGPTGAGKSAYAYHAAFKLKEENDYEIVPVRQPSEITQYYLPDTHQVFIIDDFIGKYGFDEAESVSWEKEGPLLHKVLSKNDQIKVILTCRKSIWHSEQCKRFGFSAFVCDLQSDELGINLSETRTICETYVEKNDAERLSDELIMMYTFFPSLCSIFSSNNVDEIESFFTMPFQFIEEEINKYKRKSQVSYISLAVLAIEQKIAKKSFFDNVEHEELIQNLFRESGFQTLPSKKLIISHLLALTDTYIKVDNDCFEFIHQTMQNIVLYCIAKTFLVSVLKYCSSGVFMNQVRLACITEEQIVPVIKVTYEHENAYFTRLAKELCEGQYMDVFENNQNAFAIFRKKWLFHLNKITKKILLKTNSDGMTLLHAVSSLGYEDYVSYFTKTDDRLVNKTDSKGNTPLHLASLNGHLNIVKYLVEKGRNVHILNNDQVSPFFYACENNNLNVVKYLINLGANLVKINERYTMIEDKSVLHIVCQNGLTQIVQILLDNHATVDIQDKNGFTPLHLSCLNGQVASASLLIVARANLNLKEKKGETPLHMACQIGNEHIVNLLIDHNASINSTTKDDITPFHEACNNGHQNVANILLNKNANFLQKNKNGWTALLFSCAKGYNDIVKMLLNLEIDVNISNKDGITPLMLACRGNHTNVVESLLVSKADVNQCNNFKSSPLEYTGNVDIVNLLLEHGASINLANKNGVTPLHVACMNKHAHVVNVLIEKKADINSKDFSGGTPLYKTCFNGDIEIVQILLNKGANINITDTSGKSPVAIAKEKGFSSIVELLGHANTVLV